MNPVVFQIPAVLFILSAESRARIIELLREKAK